MTQQATTTRVDKKPASSSKNADKKKPATSRPKKATAKAATKKTSSTDIAESSTSSRFTETEQQAIHEALARRKLELQSEHSRAMADLHDLQSDRSTEGAGDDQADAGSHTFEREQELALANGILERISQVEHAEARLDAGTYGQCEQCGNPIPKARLEVFPAATLCVDCKQKQERR